MQNEITLLFYPPCFPIDPKFTKSIGSAFGEIWCICVLVAVVYLPNMKDQNIKITFGYLFTLLFVFLDFFFRIRLHKRGYFLPLLNDPMLK